MFLFIFSYSMQYIAQVNKIISIFSYCAISHSSLESLRRRCFEGLHYKGLVKEL